MQSEAAGKGSTALVATAGAMLLVLAGIAWLGMLQSQKNSEWYLQAHETSQILEQVMANIYRAETAQREMAQTRSADSRKARDAALLALDVTVKQLDQLTRQHHPQQERLSIISDIIGQRGKAIRTGQSYLQAEVKNTSSMQLPEDDAFTARMKGLIDQATLEQQRQWHAYQAGSASYTYWLGIGFGMTLTLAGLMLHRLARRLRQAERLQARSIASLAQGDAHFRQIMAVLPVSVHVVDAQGVSVLINQAGHRLWAGIEHVDIEQYGQFKATRLDDGKPVGPTEWGLARALNNGDVISDEALEITCFDGTSKTVLSSAIPLRDAGQHIVGAVAVCNDVTDLRRTTQGLRKLQEELESRVIMRTAELERSNQSYQEEIAECRWAEEALQQSQKMLRHFYMQQEYVKEDERKRIARKIHDELGQNLLALRIDIAMLFERTRRTHPRLNEKVGNMLSNIDATVKSVRVIINHLRPAVLDLGLYAAIEWQVNEFKWRTGIQARIVSDQESQDFDAEFDDNSATAIFRIFQESLNNITRHAQAANVVISLRHEHSSFVMRISDDGKGIAPGSRQKENSYGLVGIEERLRGLSGQFAMESTPGHGTTLTVTLPVKKSQGQADTHNKRNILHR